jgi:hypothetical protein
MDKNMRKGRGSGLSSLEGNLVLNNGHLLNEEFEEGHVKQYILNNPGIYVQ